nr:hypothetical protein [Raoultella planticola]
MDHLGLVEAVDGLGQCVVERVAHAAHRGLQARLGQPLGVSDRHVLDASVAVVDQAIRADRLPRVQRLLERVEHEVRLHRAGGLPAHDATGEHVDDESDVDPSLPSRDVREVADPQRVRPIGLELPLHVIERARRLRIAHRRAHGLASNNAPQPKPLHQPLHGTARNVDSLAPQLPPDLAYPVDLVVVVPHALHLGYQYLVGLHPLRSQLRIGLPGRMRVVRRRGDLQHLADRLDPVNVSLLIDESLHRLKGRSSSAWAKYADALRRISLAWRSSRTSRSSALMRSFSAVVTPSRLPVSRSCWRSQPRSVSAVQPTLAATDTIAAHCDSYSSWCSSTIFTDRSRTSGENLLALLIAPSSQGMEPPDF